MSFKVKERKTDRRRQEKRLDDLFSLIIRKRAMQRVGGCERCKALRQSHKELQTAHFHSRRKHTTRWDIRNSVGLCGGCHQYLDSNKEAKIAFEIECLGEEEYERLYVLAEMTTKTSPVDYNLTELYLKELLKEGI